MNRTIFLFVIMSFNFAIASDPLSPEAEKCFNNSKLKDRVKMADAFSQQNYTDFEKRFHLLCGKYSKELTCQSETIKLEMADDRMKELIAKGICAEVYRVDTKDQAKIYFINSVVVPVPSR